MGARDLPAVRPNGETPTARLNDYARIVADFANLLYRRGNLGILRGAVLAIARERPRRPRRQGGRFAPVAVVLLLAASFAGCGSAPAPGPPG
jgi:hypothetical protein